MPDESKQAFVNLQQSTSEIIANTIKGENDWIYRGISPDKQNRERTATRGSLNIEVTPQSVSELDKLIRRGILFLKNLMAKKIAVFHNYMDNIGGAERVCLTLARELDADLYSTNINYEAINKLGFSNIRTISIGKIPINAPLRQQVALTRFRYFRPKINYDYYIIGGDWAISGTVRNKPNLVYVHSPIREIWDLYQYTRSHMVLWHKRSFYDVWVWYNRALCRKYFREATHVACNSKNTQERIKKYLHLDTEIIYPPIDTKNYHYTKNGDYWLSVNRLLGLKRVEIQMESFRKLSNERLIIVGSYEPARHFVQYVKYLESIKPPNVEIKSWVNASDLIDLYAGCKGFITTSHDEDFGMTAIEAMASGKPVIAPNEGGYRESILNGKTGILIDSIDVNKFVLAIDFLSKDTEQYKDACLAQAKKFDTEVFVKKIKAVIGI